MQAPSVTCLRALWLIAIPYSSPTTRIACRRCYATAPKRATQSPLPPPPKTYQSLQPAFRPSPSGSDLRKKRDDDEDLTPHPLSRPIGMPEAPQPGDNTGLDSRTLKQRRDDFHDYEKHLEKRARMTKQIAKPYFRDWSNMRFHKGKVFVANDRLFRADHALYFPNFFGQTIQKSAARMDRKDGYGGFGRNTCEVMRGRVSVVSILSNEWAERQVDTFCSRSAHPELHEVLKENADVAQRVEINYEDNVLKWWLLQVFARRNLRKSRTVEEQERYFMVRRGFSEIMKEAIGVLNDKGGYVYLVDQDCKIRWGGSAEALPTEKESMVRGLRKLVQEARMSPEEREATMLRRDQLDSAVADIVDASPAPLSTTA